MTAEKPSLEGAYALETPEDNQRLYAQWAADYDRTFARAMDYRMPGVIGNVLLEVGAGAAPVLDVGAGTGLMIRDTPMPGELVIDALDISAEMLQVAAETGGYRELLACDLTKTLPIEDQQYGAIVSAGTFTHGHVGPEALDELLRIAKRGAVFVLGINAQHFAARGFEAKLALLEPNIEDLEIRTVDIYGAGADDDHRHDQANVVVFRRRA